ncbi:MAG: rubrerythrin, partial [Syntrophomonadaceae bacterium]|nr:rubrerythrin [Syntrophomonadaceae bacterium]
MKLYRCLICGEAYMGTTKPSNCPFCGAPEEYLAGGDQWVDENLGLGELSEVSRSNLARALQLEVNNSAFYRDAMNRTSDIELQGVFKYLSKVEAEHASTIRKIIRVEPP